MSKKFVGLIGYPAKHSVSPAFQQAAFDFYGLEAEYKTVELVPAELEGFIACLRQPDALGVNVTIPYKETVIPLLDELSPRAVQIGAVNTIKNDNGALVGYNTDADGFTLALLEGAGFEPSGCRVVLLGAGGAARAVAVALLELGVDTLAIFNRHQERASALVEQLRALGKETSLSAPPWQEEELRKALEPCHLLVNATSVGMKPEDSPLPPELIPPQALIFDLVYNPPKTLLLAEGEARGAKVISGLPMLVYQGAAAFELWTGRTAPVEVMMQAARAALGIGG